MTTFLRTKHTTGRGRPVRPAAATRPGGTRWEDRLLAAMAYPMNLAAAGLAALILSLPLVSAVPAGIAAARAMNGWLRDGDSAVFTATFREFRATWRRSLPLGVAAVVACAMLAVNAAFLGDQLTSAPGPVALVLTAATVPVSIAVALLLLAIPVAAARRPEATRLDWVIEAGYLIARAPLRALFLLALVIAAWLTFYLVPALAPFFALSVPGYLALVTLDRSTDTRTTKDS